MPRPNVLVIAVDGLRASALGAYGNTWYRTPSLDRFAARSILCDWAFADSPNLPTIYRGLWQATSALRAAPIVDADWSLPSALAQFGYHTQFITDAEELTHLTVAQHFANAMLLDNRAAEGVREVEQTCVASMLAEMLSFLEEDRPQQQPWFLWAHLRGFYGAWDAPHDLALSLVDEDDAPPEPSTEAPNQRVDRSADADEIFAQTCRYAAQVMAFDSLFAPLLDVLDSSVAGECIVILLGTRGFPLGEHGQLGGRDQRLYSEQLHVPLLIRLPNNRDALRRISRLTLPADISSTILGVIEPNRRPLGNGFNISGDLQKPWRSYVLAAGGESNLSIRTPAWYLRADSHRSEGCELFVKPDDRWEANDIASLCPEIAAELAELVRNECDRIVAGEPAFAAILPDSLTEPMN